MHTVSTAPRSVKVIRWVARIWSIFVFAFALMVFFSPDSYATEPVPIEDWFLLSLWGFAILGLLIAWRWERLGSLITIATMFFREIAWVIFKGPWMMEFLIFWALVVPPAVLFLLAWNLDRLMRRA